MTSAVLDALCVDERRRAEYRELAASGALARVVRVDRDVVSVLCDEGLLRVATLPSDGLIVGDWVALNDKGATRLERRSELVRRAGPHHDQRQPLVANVDVVLVVRALDTPVALDRLSSFLVIAHDSGTVPVVVLTKSDLVDQVEAEVAATSAGLGGVETLAVSTVTGSGMDELRTRIAGRTIVLLGESGAGKSTLTNALCGREQLATAEVDDKGQGRHTTTHRELVVIPSGGVVIDTPGIRAVASFGDGAGIERSFADVVAVATRCRFSDCAHDDTPGCAVALALEDGELTQQRLDGYLKERSELDWLEKRMTDRQRSSEQGRGARRRGR